MLWIALYLPQLPLQLVQRIGAPQLPCVIADGPLLRPLVFCASDSARERGIKLDMPVAAARALAGDLAVLPRDTQAEEKALHNLACWASQFTPGIVVKSGEGLLLDVSSVLTLHGGLSRLLIRIGQGIKALGYHAEPGVAPTPLASWLLAKARYAKLPVRMCRDAALLPERLAALPMHLLDWPIDELNKLNALGIRRIGDCVNLPRDGFIRRFGAQRRLELDRMLGIEPDPRKWFTSPDHFNGNIDFGFEVTNAMMLLFPLKRLLQELEGFLRGRGAGVQHWQLELEHMSHRSSTIDMRLVAPERSAERLVALARDKLAQLTLDGPVLGIGLVATELLAFEENNRTLIPDPRSRAIGWSQLVDKLTTRLGNERVYRLQAVDDHRPEQAWKQETSCERTEGQSPLLRRPGIRSARKERNSASHSPVPRPLWLLRTPRTLLSEMDEPLCHGRLRLIAGPERIESGWWDGQGARRDYYVARNGKGETFWIYREHRRSRDWYLHGIFS
ncbi:MAG TPA: DNA polymerase Y family protein [Pseudomonadales bacterium]